MAVKKGQYAKVMLDVEGTPTQVMELREWSISGETEKIDSSVAGDDWSKHLIGRGSWEAEATCISADQFWLELMFTQFTVDFFDHQDDTDPVYSGKVSMDFERTAPYDDIIESSLTFTGNGKLNNPAGATPEV